MFSPNSMYFDLRENLLHQHRSRDYCSTVLMDYESAEPASIVAENNWCKGRLYRSQKVLL